MAEVLGTDPGDGISGVGTTLQGAVTGPIGMINRINLDGSERDVYDVTTMNSADKWRQFIPGLKDAKEATLDLLYEKENYSILQDAIEADPESWTITFPDGSTFVCSGFIRKVGVASPFDEKMTQSVTIKFTGKPVFTDSST